MKISYITRFVVFYSAVLPKQTKCIIAKHPAIREGQDSLLSGMPEWYNFVWKEYEACRERVGLIDMSHFSKFDISVSPFGDS